MPTRSTRRSAWLGRAPASTLAAAAASPGITCGHASGSCCKQSHQTPGHRSALFMTLRFWNDIIRRWLSARLLMHSSAHAGCPPPCWRASPASANLNANANALPSGVCAWMISRALLPAPRAAVRGGQRAAVRARPAAALRSSRPAAWALRGSGASALRRPLRSQPEGAAEEAPPAAEAAPAEAALAPAEAAAAKAAPAPAAAARPGDAENEMDLSEVEWTSDADWAQAAGYTRDGMVRPRLHSVRVVRAQRSAASHTAASGRGRDGPNLTHCTRGIACRTSSPRTRGCGRTQRTCSTAGPSSCSAAGSWRFASRVGAPSWPEAHGADARMPPNAEVRGRPGRVFHGALPLKCCSRAVQPDRLRARVFRNAGLPQIRLQPRGQRHRVPRVGAGSCRGVAHRRLQRLEPQQVRCRCARAWSRCTRS